MKRNEMVRPVIEDGIEFYVSKDGSIRGISQLGAAKLCGIADSPFIKQLRRWFDRSSKGSNGEDCLPLELEHLRGADLYVRLSSPNQAKILDSKVVASIVSYYAFQRQNKVAMYSLQKFASIGIDTWIDTVTGSVGSLDGLALMNQMNATMGKMMVKLENLERIEEETLGYRKATVTMPILEKWMIEIGEAEKQKILAPSDDLITIKEAMKLCKPKINIDDTIARKLALKVSQTVNALTGEATPKTHTKNGKGTMMKVNGYSLNQLPLIRLCYNAVLIED